MVAVGAARWAWRRSEWRCALALAPAARHATADAWRPNRWQRSRRRKSRLYLPSLRTRRPPPPLPQNRRKSGSRSRRHPCHLRKSPSRRPRKRRSPSPKKKWFAQATPAPGDSAAEKAKPDEEQAPAKKLDPPSVDEQKRLIHEIDEVYKPGRGQGSSGQGSLGPKTAGGRPEERGQPGRAVRAFPPRRGDCA